MSLESVTAEWMRNMDKVGVGTLYSLAALARTPGALSAYYGAISAAIDAQAAAAAAPFAASAGAGAIAAGALPVITAVGVWVALGSGYYQARQILKQENAMSGFSQGFVCGLLRWTWDQTLDKFRRYFSNSGSFDPAADHIRVNSYHEGLKKGFLAGMAMPKPTAKDFLTKMRQLANVSIPNADTWRGNRIAQYSYVISLAAAARVHSLIRAE